MSLTFAATISSDCVSFTGITGKNHVIGPTHTNNEKIRKIIRELGVAKKNNADELVNDLWQQLEDLADIPAFVEKSSNGKVTVKNGNVYYNDEVIHSTLSERILWGLSEDYNMDSYIKFMENLMENPSKRAVDELYGFMEAAKMGITDDGHLIAYKRVRSNYTDCHSGKFDNSVGKVLEMPRNKVDDDKTRTCSYGFHFCSQSYLPLFGRYNDDKVVIVKVNPRDVVSIPADYNNAKARACRYEVIGEYTGSDKNDILSQKPIWSSNGSEFKPDDDFQDRYWDEEDDDFEDQRWAGGSDAHDDEEFCDTCEEFIEYCECHKPNIPVDDIPEDFTDESQFSTLAPIREEIDEVAVTKTNDGKVKTAFSFEDGLSKYDVVVEIGPDGAASAKVIEEPVSPNRGFEDDDHDTGC